MKKIYNIAWIGCLMLLLAACEKDTEASRFAPQVTTGNATGIYRKGATLAGTIQMNETSVDDEYGILFSKLKSMKEYTEYPVTSDETEYRVHVRDLEPGQTYYYCAYAHSSYSLIKGEIKSFVTTENNPPVFSEITVDSVGTNRVYLSTEILDDGGAEVVISGFCWKEGNTGIPTYIDNVVNVTDVKNNKLQAVIRGLAPNKDYMLSAYSVNTNGMGFSESVSVKTQETKVPFLGFVTPVDSTASSITLSAKVMEQGTDAVTRIGFCWSKTEEEPVLPEASRAVADGYMDMSDQLGQEEFTMTLEHLDPASTYYIRAYAQNGAGLGYSETFTFSTKGEIPSLDHTVQKESTEFSVSVETQILNIGTSAISHAGFCWSTENQEPTIDDEVVEYTDPLVGAHPVFSITMSDLKPGTTYYIRGYAMNETGVCYSDVITFKAADAKKPALSAVAEKESTFFGVDVEAELTDAGTYAVTAAGFCWSTENKEPTTADAHQDLTAQLTESNRMLSLSLTDLEPGSTVYIRAYATNEVGTTYSEVYAFTASEGKVPVLSALTQTAATNLSVSFKAELEDVGTSDVTKAGFCWSTEKKEPTVEDNSSDLTGQLSGGKTTLSSLLDKLTFSTTYYIRAYATNEQGLGYSEVFVFTTVDPAAPTIASITQTASSDFSVSFEAQLKDKGTSDITKAGFCWSTTNQEPTVADSSNDLTSSLSGETPKWNASLTDLEPGSTVYIRAYASNSEGMSYSEVLTFTATASKAPVLSAVTTAAAEGFAVTAQASLTDAGIPAATKVGFCWSMENKEPTTSDSSNDLSAQITDSIKTFKATLADLEPGATYYIRAYAVNTGGTVYSNAATFTVAPAQLASLSSIVEKGFTVLTRSIEATLLDAGKPSVTAAGFCWSASASLPTVSDSYNNLVSQVTGNNSTLSATLTGLASTTTYRVRAYATNKAGTVYSDVFTFTTGQAIMPTLTVGLKDTTSVSFILESELVNKGSSDVKAIGFCWSATNTVPTISDSKKDCTSQLGSGVVTIENLFNNSDLKPNTTYYFRAYATNSEGTGYSESVITVKTPYGNADWEFSIGGLPTQDWK